MANLRNRKGQVAVESIMMTAILAVITLAGINYLRQQGTISHLITKPWKKVAGMTEYGNWDDPGPAAQAKHPNTNDRAYSKK